jgi:UDP-N-acetylmuramate: L-alanyl-gamma-D-glutamyl-meso-diaminopimelate ligase
MNFDRLKRVYLIGICGTAMASLAGLLKEKGFEVSGSDSNVYPPMSDQLKELGIPVHSSYQPENLATAKPDLVIPGNAVPRGNPEVEAMLNLRLPYLSMAEAVKEFFLRDKRSLVISGTHGKTTTSSIAAWVLESAGSSPSFLVGGVPLNFGKSFQWKERGEHFVIEGDEYDTGFMDRRPKFVSYLPDSIILNPVEFDHADLYPDQAAVEHAFWQLVKVVPGNGCIIVARDSETSFQLASRGYSKVVSFGFHPKSDYRISAERWIGGKGRFQLNGVEYAVPLFGKHNIANAAAVAVLAERVGLNQDQIREGLVTFRGVKRRMELRGEVEGVAVFDDFAHHPTAINSTLEGARLAFPNSRVWGIFEPRSWSSRRNIFQREFARAFGFANRVVIAAVHEPEKVAAEIRLDPQKLVRDIDQNGVPARYIPDKEELIQSIVQEASSGDKLILMSNGSFDGAHEKLLDALKVRFGEVKKT